MAEQERDEGQMECPMCASRNISYSESEHAWICRDCGSVTGGQPVALEKPKQEVVREIIPEKTMKHLHIVEEKPKAKKKIAKKKAKKVKKKAVKKVKKKAKPKKVKFSLFKKKKRR